MILTKDEFRIRLQERFGESASDDDIRLLEDITDTIGSYEDHEAEKQLAELQEKYADDEESISNEAQDAGNVLQPLHSAVLVDFFCIVLFHKRKN